MTNEVLILLFYYIFWWAQEGGSKQTNNRRPDKKKTLWEKLLSPVPPAATPLSLSQTHEELFELTWRPSRASAYRADRPAYQTGLSLCLSFFLQLAEKLIIF